MKIDFQISKPVSTFQKFKMLKLFLIDNQVDNLLSAHTRLYHNLWHVTQMFSIHEQLKNEWEDLTDHQESNLLEAIYWHDAIYDTSSKEIFELNEIKSAALFEAKRKLLRDTDIQTNGKYSQQYWNLTGDLILATKGHFKERPYDELTEWFLGLDLASLAAPWDMFKLNNKLIRLEFYNVSDDEWNKNRHWFLKHALEQDKIYRHPVMHKHFETLARYNIHKLLLEDGNA
jgi:predicted metal-dependent HD superfamily phosphohydrolase